MPGIKITIPFFRESSFTKEVFVVKVRIHLVCNSVAIPFQLSLVGSENLSVVAGSTDKSTIQTTQTDHTALLHQAGVAAFTLGGDQGQQVYVITDPAQLEALQVMVSHIYPIFLDLLTCHLTCQLKSHLNL